MYILPIIGISITFEGKHQLKTLWRAGKLPTVKIGIYGGELTQDTLSIEHLEPRALGGTNAWGNVTLATKKSNNARGCDKLSNVLTRDMFLTYAKQFKGIRIKGFNGNKYIKEITETIIRIFKSEGKKFE